nr:class II glutamine amidotransferase [Betaproteobacteria bacterium]
MCAIFGFIARRPDARVNLRTLAAIARGNVARGPHAFGFAWVDVLGRLRMYKQTGRLVDHLGVLSMARDARMLIGHLRYATHGDAGNNLNNHPHPADGGWIVHNGVLRNYEPLIARHRLRPVSECDSEALGLLIEQSEDPSLSGRVADAVNAADGPLAMLGIW